MGCANCHDDINKKPNKPYPEMAKLRLGHGCLSNQNQAPRYDLDEEQKKLIAAALRADKNFEYSDEQKNSKNTGTV